MISISNEFWKYLETGKVLISNQDFYNYAEGQFPGSVNKIEFTTFRINSLLKDPFISDKTSASFPTEIFARTFFDYEWRFLSPEIPFANNVGRFAYFLGIIWLLYFLSSMIILAWKGKNVIWIFSVEKYSHFIPILVGILFMFVPLIQTLRYPYFSSMKTTFALPGIIILLIMHVYFTREMKIPGKFSLIITLINLTYGIILIYTICVFLPISIGHLHGPLWIIPK